MNTSEYISYLLKYHECVIIPEFGGFISNYQAAEFNPITHTFSPPSKEVVFNAKINKNDGLLINHIVEKENIDYHQAQQKVLTFVDQLYDQLNHGIKVELHELGIFELDRSGSLVFSEKLKFEFTGSYGLESFNYSTLQQPIQRSTFKHNPAIRAFKNRSDILKIAASISLLLALSIFPMKNDHFQLQSSSINPIQILNSKQVATENGKEIVDKEGSEESINIKETNAKAPYILVGGSFQQLNNAKQLLNSIKLYGEQPKIFKLKNGFYRVVIDSFFNKDEAMIALDTYRTNHPDSNAWMSIP